MRLNNIYLGDCLELMPKIPSNSIDFICADLPYGITDNKWDKKIDINRMWSEFYRIGKSNVCIALFACGKFMIELAYSRLEDYRYNYTVDKGFKSNFLNAKKMPLRCCDNVLIFYKSLPTYNPQFTYSTPYYKKSYVYTENYNLFKSMKTTSSDGRRYPSDLLKFCYPLIQKGKVIHPTQKPVELLEFLIKTYTNENETVFDCCIGSGTTAIAAINTNRNFIGFELNEKYYKIALNRIKTTAQTKLFP